MKFNTEHTQGGYKILSLHSGKNPDTGLTQWAGVIEDYHGVRGMTWDEDGESEGYEGYNLIPLAPTFTYSKWINVYSEHTSTTHETSEAATRLAAADRIGIIRVDWKDNGTFDVVKEDI